MPQDFRLSVRPVIFQTELPDFLYATHGGTIFVIQFKGSMYGITCKHVFKEFDIGALVVPNERHPRAGSKPAIVEKVSFAVNPKQDSVDSDLLDLAVVVFRDYVTPEFFGPNAYVTDKSTVVQSRAGHRLMIFGALKDKLNIAPPNISIGYCELEFLDQGAYAVDGVLRVVHGKWAAHFENLTRLSGAPVFDLDLGSLCGMSVSNGVDHHLYVKGAEPNVKLEI